MPKKRRLSKSTYQGAYKNRNKGSSSRQGCIDWKAFGKDRDIKFYKPKEGVNKLNIIPFEITNKMNPIVKSKDTDAEIGSLDMLLDIWVHRYTGPDNVDVLCPKKNYGKSCPLCDKYQEKYSEGKEKEAKDFRATRRAIINVQPIIQGEPQPLQVFDVSHWLFMKELLEEAHACKDGEDIVEFANIDSGKIVKFRLTLEPWGKTFKPDFKSFNFLDRKEELEDKLIDEAISFDKGLLPLLSAEEIEKVMYGQDEDEDEPSKSDKPSPERDEEEDDPPPRKVDRDPDDEDDEEEDPPPKKKKEDKSDTKKGKCPSGHEWGEADDHKECKDCPKSTWDECMEA